MRITVGIGDDSRIAINITLDENEPQVNTRYSVTNHALLRAFVPNMSISRITTAATQTLGRGNLGNGVYNARSLIRTLSLLGVEVTGQQLCEKVAELVANDIMVGTTLRGNHILAVPLGVVRSDTWDVSVADITPGISAMLSIGGKLYSLQPTESTDGDLVGHIRREFEQSTASYRAAVTSLSQSMGHEVDRRVTEVERRFRQATPMPPITLADVRKGLVVYVSGEGVFCLLPFHYRPKYLQMPDGTRYKILPDMAGRLECHCMISFLNHNARDNEWHSPLLVSKNDFTAIFRHYHNGCWGTLDFRGMITSVPDSLYHLRDMMQVELETINTTSLAFRGGSRELGSLPAISDVEQALDRSATVDISTASWRSQPAPQNTPENEQHDLHHNADGEEAAGPSEQEVRPRGWRIQ